MVPVFRFAAAALTAALVLSSAVVSQEAPDPGQPVLREYSTVGLTTAGLEQAPPPGAVGDLLSPDLQFGDGRERELNQWSLRESGREATCWPNAEELLCNVAGFCSLDQEDWTVRPRSGRPNVAVLEASAEMHRRVDWAMKALVELAEVRVNVRVLRLPEDGAMPGATLTRAQLATLAPGAAMVGSAGAGLGDPVILQKSSTSTYIADYQVSLATGAGAHTPVTGTLVNGDEFVAGVVALPDGRLWLQGWHAHSNGNVARRFMTSGGSIDLPHLRYGYTPVSAVIENGGAALLDAGDAGRFLVAATTSAGVPDRSLDCGDGRELRLINAVGVLRGFPLASRWLMNANVMDGMDDGRRVGLIFIDRQDYVDGPYNDAANVVINMMDRASPGCQLSVIGPYLGMSLQKDDEDADAREIGESVTALCRGEGWAGVRIRALRVAPDAAVPSGVLNGRPTEAELELLAALPEAEALFDRVSTAGLQQNIDLLDLRMTTMVRGYDMQTATGITVHAPDVRTLLTGTQMRWVAREGRSGALMIEARAGVTVGSNTLEEMTVRLEGQEFAIHRARSNLVQARFSAELQPGESAAHMCPAHADNDGLLVFVVTRLP